MGNIELFDIEKEYDLILKKAAEKYGYNEDLKGVLRRVLPAMLTGRSYEEREIFYQMLQETPIVVVDEDEDIKKISDEMFAGLNPHIKEEEEKESVYNKSSPAGFFKREPIIDENMRLVGKKQAVFIKGLDTSKMQYGPFKDRVDLFGTGIQVSHLIHELGHAWYSQINGLVQQEDGSIISRMGTYTTKINYIDCGNGEYICQSEPSKNLIIEEAMNSDLEETALKRFLGIDDDRLKQLYRAGTLINSNYQKTALILLRAAMKLGMKIPLEKYRMYGNEASLEKTNNLLARTEWYKTRDEQTESVQNKENILGILSRGEEILDDGSIQKISGDRQKRISKRQSFVKLIEDDFFGKKDQMTPIEYFDNILTQAYDINTDFLTFTLAEYKSLIGTIIGDVNTMLRQSIEISKTDRETSKKTEQK